MESICKGSLNILEAIRFLGEPVKLFNAGSSECFGDTGVIPADERTLFRPHSPYAAAKAWTCWTVKNYRESYGILACTGILCNHESPFRPERFVTQKIVHAAARISSGSTEKLQLGNIDIWRDWGWAPDYVDAMWRMLQQDVMDDIVIASGKTNSLKYFISKAFETLNLNWRDHVIVNTNLFRLTDLKESRANPSKAREILGWQAKLGLDMVIERMCEAALNNQAGHIK
jgi:GDPmannose 4,6-dehydratase